MASNQTVTGEEKSRPMHLLCPARSDRTSCGFVGANNMTTERGKVTCKRCLRAMAVVMRTGGLQR